MTISSTLTTIGQRVNVNFGMKYGSEVITNLDSVAVERRATLLDAGPVKLQGEWLGSLADHQFIMTTLLTANQPLNACQLILSTATHGTWAFNAIITNFELSGMEIDKHVRFDMELEISGVPTFT